MTALKPTDIIVHYFVRDAEDLPPGGGNIVLRHSYLAVTLWAAWHKLIDRSGEAALVEHYRQAYQPTAPGFLNMTEQLRRLASYARESGIAVHLAMIPEFHNLVDYQFGFIHDIMRNVAQGNGYGYVDLLPALKGRTPQEIWAMPGDPHPNSLGHELMASSILPAIAAK